MAIRTVASRTDGTLQTPVTDPRDTACWYLTYDGVFWMDPPMRAVDDPTYELQQWSLDLSETKRQLVFGSGPTTIAAQEFPSSREGVVIASGLGTFRRVYLLPADQVSVTGYHIPQLQLVEPPGQESSQAQSQLTLADQWSPEESPTLEPEHGTNPFIVYAKIAIERPFTESRFFANTVKEAFLHPLSTSAIDKRTGKVIKQARID